MIQLIYFHPANFIKMISYDFICKKWVQDIFLGNKILGWRGVKC